MRLNCYGVEVGTSLRFWESKRWIRPADPYGCFQWYFRYWKKEEKVKMILGNGKEGRIGRWKGIVSRFVGILKKVNSEGKDSMKIRQILLHWCYEMEKPSVM